MCMLASIVRHHLRREGTPNGLLDEVQSGYLDWQELRHGVFASLLLEGWDHIIPNVIIIAGHAMENDVSLLGRGRYGHQRQTRFHMEN